MTGAQARLALGAALALTAAAFWGLGSGLYVLAVALVIAGLAAIPSQHRPSLRLALIFAEIALATAAMLYGNPLGLPHPKAMLFHGPGLLVLLALMAVNAGTIRPLQPVWAGISAMLCWSVAAWITWHDALTIKTGDINDENYDTLIAFLGAVMQPRFFSMDILWWQLAILGGCTVILGVLAWRARSLARNAAARQAMLAGLSAHFAPVVAEALAAGSMPREGRMQLAVHDSDLVGFSGLAARISPEAVAAGLRAYHGFVEEAVFANGGAVLKYVGDGVIAVFGFTGEDDAARAAWACGQRLAAEWPAAGAGVFGPGPPPQLVAGIDMGEVTAGIVGEGRAMSLVVIGPAVEGAAALQSLRGDAAGLRASDTVRAAIA